MNLHTLSILVTDKPGVLSRLTGLFSRRGFNIDSLNVKRTEDPLYSRITVVTQGDNMVLDQIQKQVHKLFDVVEIVELGLDEEEKHCNKNTKLKTLK
jgi:acetolactate synthase-1/3 small subunit